MSRRRTRWAAITAVLVASITFIQLAAADRLTPVEPSHELRGITAVRLNLSGVPEGVGTSGVTEASMRRSVVARLKQGGLSVVDDPLHSAPTLDATILPVQYESGYFVTIQVELREPCTVTRDPKIQNPFCVTWSMRPTLGIVNKGAEARVEQLLLAAIDQFVKSWQFDNSKGGKP